MHQSMFKRRYTKKPIELTSIRFELSPSEKEARHWTMSVKPTNIANSHYFAALHRDSKSGIPHQHLVGNRIDMDRNHIDVKFIGERAVMAVKAVNQRHGWRDAMNIRQECMAESTNACMDVLRSMPFFDWDEYADRLREKITTPTDSTVLSFIDYHYCSVKTPKSIKTCT